MIRQLIKSSLAVNGVTVIVGIRVMRLDTFEFLDPADKSGKTWRPTAPVKLWDAVPIAVGYGPEAKGTPFELMKAVPGYHVASIPDDGMPDDVWLSIAAYVATGQAGVSPNAPTNWLSVPTEFHFQRGFELPSPEVWARTAEDVSPMRGGAR